jgi:uncharacterized membrane protein
MQRLINFFNKHTAFLKEFRVASFVITAVLFYAMTPLLLSSNSNYPYTVDGMGHLTKIKYIADSLKNLRFSDWFPYWYNGSGVVQYYPPLSYLMQVPVQMIFDNIMITFKYFAFSSFFIGSMGVWYTCYRFLSPLSGVLAGGLYAANPFFIASLLLSGVIAQGPIFAFSPWLLFFSVLFFKKPSRAVWMTVCILSSMLILSHVMHAFMVCLCLGIGFLSLSLIKKIEFSRIIHWAAAIGLGCGLAAFWWLPGVTQLENPGIPHLLPEAGLIWTANLKWFLPSQIEVGGLYFSLTMHIISLCAVFFLFNNSKENSDDKQLFNERVFVIFNLILMIFTVIFSFGQNNPLFKYVPLNQQLVPGRILSLSCISSTLLTTYVIVNIIKKIKAKYLAYPIAILLIVIIFIDVNPKKWTLEIQNGATIEKLIESVPEKGKHFEKSRFTWVAPVNSNMTYFPLLYDFNMADGWNIEGTPHNHALWLHNTALSCDCDMYAVKNLMQWNAHSVLISRNYVNLKKAMEGIGYSEIDGFEGLILMHNPSKSSYFYKQNRDAIAIGKGIEGFSMSFPWVVAGESPNLDDYSEEELSPYKLIYFIEPDIKDLSAFEERVKQLSKQGKTIMIEMGRTEEWPILGVMPYDVTYDSSASLKPNKSTLTDIKYRYIPLTYSGQSCALSGLDTVYYTLKQKSDTGEYPAIGAKKVEGKNIYFVGMGLSQLLSPSVIRTLGLVAIQPEMSERDNDIKTLLELLMDNAKPSKKILLDPFYPDSSVWSYNSAAFKYSMDKPDDIIISLTTTPRWKIFLDGKPIPSYNFENLILLKLPAGTHSVELKYERTWVGWTGVALSILSFILILLADSYFNHIYRFLSRLVQNFINYYKQKPDIID